MASRSSRRRGVQRARDSARAKRPSRRPLAAAIDTGLGAVDDDVLRCTSQLVRAVRQMRKTYPATTLVLAMLAQTAGTLRSLVESGQLSRREAARYCREFSAYVLARNASANRSKRRTQ